jgi:hypothetical protein
MFYHGNLKDGANVKKIDFRPLYLNGPNTRIEPKIETLSDGYSEEGREEGREEGGEGEEGTEEHEGDRVDSSALLVEAKSSSSASSFLSSLTSMYKNGSQSKSLNKDTENPDKTKSNENKMSKEKKNLSSSSETNEDDVTLKPLIFFNLLTSEDSSGPGTGSGTDNSHSHSNIGDLTPNSPSQYTTVQLTVIAFTSTLLNSICVPSSLLFNALPSLSPFSIASNLILSVTSSSSLLLTLRHTLYGISQRRRRCV